MKDLRFNFADEMADIVMKVLVINQLLKGNVVDKKERKELDEEKERLVKQFIKDFQKNNKEEITKYNECKHTLN